ncbi:MAG: alpha/beta fold hydrolase, partial [Myxococcales bacterium]|nr:alpha/beta fold hydrolase [Myxococcales bacterium]
WGATADAANGPGRAAFVADLKQLLDHLEIQQAFLVSQSMGGLTCLGFALAYPDRCLGLILGDTTGGVGDSSVLDELEDVTPPAGGPGRTLSAGFIRDNSDLVFLYTQIQGMNPENPNDGIVLSFRDENGPKAAELAGLKVATCFVAGAEDEKFCVIARAFGERIPNSRFEIVADAGHAVHLENQQDFGRVAREFFAEIDAQEN